jgi:hypothetical protein
MLIYQVGSSTTAISEALGVEFKDSVDLMSGIVFVNKNKIVYKESFFITLNVQINYRLM